MFLKLVNISWIILPIHERITHTDLYKRLDWASIIGAPPEIEAGSYANLHPNL